MIKRTLLPLVLVCLLSASNAQDLITMQDNVLIKPFTLQPGKNPLFLSGDDKKGPQVYRIKPAIDVPVAAISAAWSIYGFSQIYSKEASSQAAIESLNRNNINSLDRWAAGKYSPKADENSNILFYGSIPLPLLLFLDHDIRQDFGKILFLYFETISITGIYYTGSAYLWDRYRPFVYNTSVPMHERTSGNGRNSFLGGHPALVATCTFFMAKVYSDYHPDSRFKYVLYGAGAAATLTTAYLRHIAGKHFPTDLATGIALGTLTGILVPHFHKNKDNTPKLSVVPFAGEYKGLAMIYKF